MDAITQILARVHHTLLKYQNRLKSALGDSDVVAVSITNADRFINTWVGMKRTGSPQIGEVAAFYDEFTAAMPRFALAYETCNDMGIVRRASIGLTTADEIVLQAIATGARDALAELLAADVRSAILADSAEYDADTVLRAAQKDNTRIIDTIYMATLIADRGLGSMIHSSAFESAKNTALGANKPVACNPDSLIALPPIGPRGDRASVIEGLTGARGTILVLHRHSGSTMWSNYAATQMPGKFPENGGLTRAVIDRFATIVPGADRDADLPNVSNIVDGDALKDASTVHVIETNDGKTYAAWAGGSPIPKSHPAALQLAGTCTVDRNAMYHSIMEPVIISRASDTNMANIARQYAGDNTKYSGSVQLETARRAIYERIRAMPIANRQEYMRAVGDRVANIEAIIAASKAAQSVGIREAMQRESAVSRFVVLFERKVYKSAPTVDEFAKYADPRRLVDIALTSTLDAAVVDAKRTKVFSSVDKELADYVRIYTRGAKST